MCTRLDLGPAALDGEFVQSGTTNVDFSEPMVNALSRIGRAEPVRLSVGQQEVVLERAAGSCSHRPRGHLRWPRHCPTCGPWRPAPSSPPPPTRPSTACPNVSRPWQLQPRSNTYVEQWKPGKPERTDRWTELHVWTGPKGGASPGSLLLYSLHAAYQPPHEKYHLWYQLTPLATDYPFLVALPPQCPAPLHRAAGPGPRHRRGYGRCAAPGARRAATRPPRRAPAPDQ